MPVDDQRKLITFSATLWKRMKVVMEKEGHLGPTSLVRAAINEYLDKRGI